MTEDEIIFREAWQEKARCRGMAYEIEDSKGGSHFWFPERGEKMGGSKGGPKFPALQLCDECPVMYECLDYALRNNESEGVWGGTTAMQRRKIRKKIRKQDREMFVENEIESLIDDALLDAV